MASFVVPGISSSQLCTQNQLKRASKWVFHGGVSVTSVKIMMHVVDHNQSQMGPGSGGDVSHGLHKDLCSLPSRFLSSSVSCLQFTFFEIITVVYGYCLRNLFKSLWSLLHWISVWLYNLFNLWWLDLDSWMDKLSFLVFDFLVCFQMVKLNLHTFVTIYKDHGWVYRGDK